MRIGCRLSHLCGLPICGAGLILCGSCDGNHSWYKVHKSNSHAMSRRQHFTALPLRLQPLHSSSSGMELFILTHSGGGSQSMMEEKEGRTSWWSSWWWSYDIIAIHMRRTRREARESGGGCRIIFTRSSPTLASQAQSHKLLKTWTHRGVLRLEQ